MRTVRFAFLALATVALATTGLGQVFAATGTTERVNLATSGQEANGLSYFPSVSGTGRYVVFYSNAANLVRRDTNGAEDVFRRDRQTGTTTRVSVGPNGVQANAFSQTGSVHAISSDGRYVAFSSFATNLVPGQQAADSGVFVRDLVTGTNELVSVSSDGTPGNAGSGAAAISADGRYVVFLSFASNLVSGDTNDTGDLFLHDRQTGITERVNVASDESEAASGFDSGEPSVTLEGRYVVFWSDAPNLSADDTDGGQRDVFVRDRATGTTELVSGGPGVDVGGPSISAGGRYVAFFSDSPSLVSGDTNLAADVFVHDRLTGTYERVSVSTDGAEGDAFSFGGSISADGRYVSFTSFATNLVAGDTNGVEDVFLHDRAAGTTQRVSVSSAGAQANDFSTLAPVSADGSSVAFVSAASNLVRKDRNGEWDIFVHVT